MPSKPHIPYFGDGPFYPVADAIDDTQAFVAYRLQFQGSDGTKTITRKQHIWCVLHKGHHIANISKRDTRWVKDNWEVTPQDGIMQVATRENRAYIDSILEVAHQAIVTAITARTADAVVLQIDLNRI